MDLNLNKKEKSVIAVYIIVLLMYIMIFLTIPFPKCESSWISFAFTIVALLFSLGVSSVAFRNKTTSVAVIYAYPIFRIGFAYMVIQFVVGLAICILCYWYTLPYWISLVIYMCLLGLTVILILLADNTRDIVENIDIKTSRDTGVFDFIKMEMDTIEKICEPSLFGKELSELAREIKFSDPVSNEMTKNMDECIQNELRELKNIVIAKSTDDIKEKSVNIRNMVIERNNICSNCKKH